MPPKPWTLNLSKSLGTLHGMVRGPVATSQHEARNVSCWIGVVLEIRIRFWVPKTGHHPSKKDPTRDPNLENYPKGLGP